MANIIKQGQVVYVEPNMESDYTSYNTSNGAVAKSVDLENLSISVDLEVEVKGRTYMSAQNGNQKNMTLSWQSSAEGESLSFFRGTKIPVGKNGETINSLTTNYTDCHLVDIQKDGTSEMFGIKSIDINYNNFMIPEVNIQFTDVRGVSLFAGEEIRHNQTKHGITGLANPDIEGSFFKCFFTFPYPKFILKVKGFYGEMVSYELTCSDFRSAFDSNTGNFNVNVKFVGYAFSFLGDIMVNALVAAPYSEYLGKEYWQRNVADGRFKLLDKNGQLNADMMTLGQICAEYKDIVEQAVKAASEEIASKEGGESGNGTPSATPASTSTSSAQGVQLTEIKVKYDELIGALKTKSGNYSTKNSNGDTCVNPAGSNSYAFIIDSDDDELNALIPEFTAFAQKVTECAALNNWKKGVELKKYNDCDKIFDSNQSVKEDYVPEFSLRTAIYKRSRESHPQAYGAETTYYEMWTKRINSYIYIYQDFGLKDELNKLLESQTEAEQVTVKEQEKIEQRVITEQFEKKFGFFPTVENVTRVIMAHVETLIYMISKCAETITGQGMQRSAENLNVNYNNCPDIQSDSVIGVTSDTIVCPFPKVVTTIESDGASKQEDAWIAEVFKGNYPEEAKLIESLLNAVSEVNSEIEQGLGPSNSGEDDATNAIKYPLTYFDLFSDKTENIFGDVALSDVNSIFANVCVRAFSVMVTQKDSLAIEASLYGKMDAQNFLDIYNASGKLNKLAQMIQNITADKVIDYLTATDPNKYKIDPSKKNNPWWVYSHFIHVIDDKLKMVPGYLGGKHGLFPIKKWSLHEISRKAHQVDSEPAKGLRTKEIENYMLTPVFEKGATKSTLMVIKDNPISYVKNRTQEIFSSDYETNDSAASKIFNGKNKFDFFNPSDISTSDMTFFRSGGGNVVRVADAIEYNNEGQVTVKDASLNLGAVFGDPTFYGESLDIKTRAKQFLGTIRTAPVPSIKDEADYNYCTRLSVLCYNIDDLNYPLHPLSPFFKGVLDQYLDDWVNGYYKTIEAHYKLQFKDKKSLNKALDKLNGGKKDDINSIKSTFEECLESQYYSTTFRPLYDIVYDESQNKVILFAKPSTVMTDVITNLMGIVGVCTTSRFNQTKDKYESDKDIFLKKSDLRGYLDGFISVLKENLQPVEEATETAEITLNSDPTDIKVGLYRYIKMLYDKWLASGAQDEFYKLETLFDGSNPTFHFLDSAYNRIGKSMFLNLGRLTDKIVQSQTSEGYTLLSLLSALYAENKFLFLCIQNFLDLSNAENMVRMFKPIPYYEAIPPNNHPNFIVLMPYEPSSRLDVEGADFPDDGFYLNDESTWPEMIKTKSPNGLPIPAFAVSYGHQYQNYFKNIQVDMNSPMTTEQSIKAKCLIAGIGSGQENNGSITISAGQDLYTIYSNNSYTCTVTMMGCAWVQPMMYFVLHNIPMFRGSYMIVKVNHQLHAGNMVTTFKGVRMANTATRTVQEPIFGLTNDAYYASGDYGSNGQVLTGTAYADIGNDCDYAYYDPLQRKMSANPQAEEYCYAAYCWLTGKGKNEAGLDSAPAKGICANFYAESGFNPKILLIDINKSKTTHGAGGGLASFLCTLNEKEEPLGRGGDLFKYVYKGKYLDELKKINSVVEPYYKESPKRDQHEKIMKDGHVFPISFEKQMEYLCHVIKTDGTISKISTIKTEAEAAKFWMDYYERPGDKTQNRWQDYGDKVNNAIKNQSKLKAAQNNSKDKNVLIGEIASGLTISLQNSLHSVERYNKVSIQETRLYDGAYKYVAKDGPTSNNNAIFDCLLSQYGDWFDKIEWYVGDGQSSADASCVVVHLTDKAPKSHDIIISHKQDGKRRPIVISTKAHLSESLRLILIKHFKSKNIKTVSAVKSVFRSCKMDDATTQTTFELEGVKSITDCSSIMGKGPYGVGSYGAVTNFSDSVTNPLMKKVLSDVGHYRCNGIPYKVTVNDYNGRCTAGPATWYERAGINIRGIWWTDNSAAKGNYGDAQRVLGGAGFTEKWHGTAEAARGNNGQGPIGFELKPGDVAVLLGVRSDGRYSSHGQMWTGKDWRSDTIQRGIFIYSRGRLGNHAVSIWRRDDLQA